MQTDDRSVARASPVPAFAMALIAACVLLRPVDASAQPGADVVSLKSGGMLRGTVVAIEPGREVTIIVLGTSTSRTLPWSEIERVDRAEAQPAVQAPFPAQPPALPTPVVAQAPPSPGPGAPRVHIESGGPPITLYRVSGEVATTDSEGGTSMQAVNRPVCVSPCDIVVDGRTGEWFYLGGPHVPDSQRFQLARFSQSVEAHVAPGSSRALGGGIGLTIGGASLMIFGGGLALGSLGFQDAVFGNMAHTMAISGGAVAGVGAVLLVSGIVLWRVSGRTTYELAPSSEASGKASFRPMPHLSASGLGLRF